MRISARSLQESRHVWVVALLVIALVATFQTTVIWVMAGAQRDAAHIIDISGAQRMRSQELAYLALSLGTGRADASTRTEIETTIAAIGETRAEIERRPHDLDDRGPEGRMGAYTAAIRALERNPHDAAALADVRRERPEILTVFDRDVKRRVASINAHNAGLTTDLLLGLVLQIATIVWVWRSIIAPADRRRRAAMEDLRQARAEIESTFNENPDAIAIYDDTAHVIRINRSRAELIGRDPDRILGRHLSDVVVPAHVERTREAFSRVLAGETIRDEVQLVGGDGAPVDVSVTMFPRVVDGVPVGVAVVSKDLSTIRAAQASNLEQLRRISDLYEVATAYGRSTEELLASAIGVIAARLGFDYGVVTEIMDGRDTVVATCGEPIGVCVGDSRPLAESLARFSVATDHVYEARDIAATPFGDAYRDRGWKSICGMNIRVNGALCGTIGFAAGRMRDEDLSFADVQFVRLACALLGTIIERGRQLRRLDSLAFSDALTALPNRTDFSNRLDEMLGTGSFALHYLDLDRFKRVNDLYGHSVGDAVLMAAAQRLVKGIRSGDFAARLGGDEFAIVQRGPVRREGAAGLANRIVAMFSEPIRIDGIDHDVGVSVGIALFPDHAGDARTLVEAADRALYQAKREGRHRFAFAGEPDSGESLQPDIEPSLPAIRSDVA